MATDCLSACFRCSRSLRASRSSKCAKAPLSTQRNQPRNHRSSHRHTWSVTLSLNRPGEREREREAAATIATKLKRTGARRVAKGEEANLRRLREAFCILRLWLSLSSSFFFFFFLLFILYSLRHTNQPTKNERHLNIHLDIRFEHKILKLKLKTK